MMQFTVCSGHKMPQAVLPHSVVHCWHKPCAPKQVLQFYGIFQISIHVSSLEILLKAAGLLSNGRN